MEGHVMVRRGALPVSLSWVADPLDQEFPDRQGWQLIRWMWTHARSETPVLVGGMLAAAAMSSLSASVLVLARSLLQDIVSKSSTAVLIRQGWWLVAILAGRAVLRMISSGLGAIASTHIRRNLEIACIRHMAGLPFAYMQRIGGGRLTAVLMAEVPMVAGLPALVIRSFVRAPVTILAVVGVMWYSSPLVAAAAVLTAPLLFAGLYSLSSMARHVTARTFARISSLYARMTEQMAGIRVIRSMGLIPWFSGKLIDLSTEISTNSQRSAVLSLGQGGLQELLSLVLFVAFLWWIGWRVTIGAMALRDALLLPAGLLLIREEASALSGGIMGLRRAEGAALRLSQVLAEEPELVGTIQLNRPLEIMAFEDVGFSYPGREPVLKGIDLALRPGGLTILLGDSGSGKSTLCDLGLRFRRPSAGRITYNGQDLATLTEDAVRSNTALVEQEPYLFEGTVLENLLPGFSAERNARLEASVWEALRRAEASGFVRDLEGDLDAKLIANGANLSVGQKQRLVLARALLHRPRCLILDEFTSNLDVTTEGRIMETITLLSRDIIVLCTTHRMSLLPYAREIYCLRNGALEPLETVPC